MESISGDMGCPITSIDYHSATDSVLVGDAGCAVALLANFKDQLGTAVQAQGEGPAATQTPGGSASAGAEAAPRTGMARSEGTSAGERLDNMGDDLRGSPSPSHIVEPPLPPPEDNPPTQSVPSHADVSDVALDSSQKDFPVFRGD